MGVTGLGAGGSGKAVWSVHSPDRTSTSVVANMASMRKRVAVIGSGIAGLGAAWALSRRHDVVLLEARDRLGGHAHTVDVRHGDGSIAVDTGFIVYNDVTYPHLTRLFAHLGVESQPTAMDFSFARDGVEYSSRLRGMIGSPRLLLDRSHRRMIRDILRFRREGAQLLEIATDGPIEDLLRTRGFSETFLRDYLFPMTGAIWSARRDDMGRFPARPLLRFLDNHGLIRVTNRPRWRTVTGGSREYVNRIAREIDEVRTSAPVLAIEPGALGATVHTERAGEDFDEVVIAAHSDQAAKMVGEWAGDGVRAALAAIPYDAHDVVLHSDTSFMPGRRGAWAAWNATTGHRDTTSSVTYWMNRLQSIPSDLPLFVTLNPLRTPDHVHGEYRYSHPQFGLGSTAAQRLLNDAQGRDHVWFAGAYLGYGFHEDGLQSGLNVAAALGSPAPWQDDIVPRSSAPRPEPRILA